MLDKKINVLVVSPNGRVLSYACVFIHNQYPKLNQLYSFAELFRKNFSSLHRTDTAISL